jgi:hypothetical protein
MRAYFLFCLVAAFDADLATDGAPTNDPEEMGSTFFDEYATNEGRQPMRFLQANTTAAPNTTSGEEEEVESAEDSSSGFGAAALAVLGLGGAGVAGVFLSQKASIGETYDYAADSGLLEEEYDYEYDEEYDEYFEEEEYYDEYE